MISIKKYKNKNVSPWKKYLFKLTEKKTKKLS